MTRFSTKALPVAALAAIAAAVLAPAAQAQVWVNGVQLNPQQQALLQEYTCGPVPAGSYWINPQTGRWGYVGNARPMGHLRDRCGKTSFNTRPNGSRKSLSERGMLFRPGEIANGY